MVFEVDQIKVRGGFICSFVFCFFFNRTCANCVSDATYWFSHLCNVKAHFNMQQVNH